jgi:predicted lysophospholipase L1 biosynthesis ABC-type transport system permease subunit
MRRSAIIAIGFCLGLVVAGAVNAALVTLLPEGLRSVGLVWGTTGLATAVTIAACWILFPYRRP